MNRSTMEKAIRNIYQLGYDAALKENAVDFNIDGLREELHQIKGIGEYEEYIGKMYAKAS